MLSVNDVDRHSSGDPESSYRPEPLVGTLERQRLNRPPVSLYVDHLIDRVEFEIRLSLAHPGPTILFSLVEIEANKAKTRVGARTNYTHFERALAIGMSTPSPILNSLSTAPTLAPRFLPLASPSGSHAPRAWALLAYEKCWWQGETSANHNEGVEGSENEHW